MRQRHELLAGRIVMSNANDLFFEALQELLNDLLIEADSMEKVGEGKQRRLYECIGRAQSARTKLRERREQGHDESSAAFPGINRVLWGIAEAQFYFIDTLYTNAVRSGRKYDDEIHENACALMEELRLALPTFRVTDDGKMVTGG